MSVENKITINDFIKLSNQCDGLGYLTRGSDNFELAKKYVIQILDWVANEGFDFSQAKGKNWSEGEDILNEYEKYSTINQQSLK